MAFAYQAAVKTARMQVVADALDDGSTLVIGTVALAGAVGVLAEIVLDSPTPATVAGAVLSLEGLPLEVAAIATGVAALAELRDSLGNVIVGNLSVGVAGTDIIVNSTAIALGQTVICNAGAITHS